VSTDAAVQLNSIWYPPYGLAVEARPFFFNSVSPDLRCHDLGTVQPPPCRMTTAQLIGLLYIAATVGASIGFVVAAICSAARDDETSRR
jgi:hypothetical protein